MIFNSPVEVLRFIHKDIGSKKIFFKDFLVDTIPFGFRELSRFMSLTHRDIILLLVCHALPGYGLYCNHDEQGIKVKRHKASRCLLSIF